MHIRHHKTRKKGSQCENISRYDGVAVGDPLTSQNLGFTEPFFVVKYFSAVKSFCRSTH